MAFTIATLKTIKALLSVATLLAVAFNKFTALVGCFLHMF
jgi:hypothetical protein